MCLSSILLKNTDLRYSSRNYNEYSLRHSDDIGLTLSPGRFRSDIKGTLIATGTVMNRKSLGVGQGTCPITGGFQAHSQISGVRRVELMLIWGK